jgi:hypothetical protein
MLPLVAVVAVVPLPLDLDPEVVAEIKHADSVDKEIKESLNNIASIHSNERRNAFRIGIFRFT